MSLKAALYIRTSTDNQKESIKIQTQELEKYCNAKGYTIYDKYVDFGYTGKNAERPAFKTMMQEAKEHKFNVVLVTKIDRFARSIIDCLVNVEILQTYDISFSATSQPIDTGSSMGRLTLSIMAAFADFEREIINERMKAGKEAAQRRGIVCNRPRKQISKSTVLKYLDKGLSAGAVSKIMNVSTGTITDRLHEWGYIHHNGKWTIRGDGDNGTIQNKEQN